MGRKQNSHSGLTRRQLLKYGIYGGLAAGLSNSLWLGGCSKRVRRNKPNIIVLTVDTLRADHMGLHGYHRDTMPMIEAFARTAAVFDNAVVSRGSTCPSYASMLTGLYPFHHGVYNNRPVLHEDLTTLPEVLRSAGYHTAAFMSNFVLVGEISGCHQGFDIYDDWVEEREANRTNYERTAGSTVKAILEWLESNPPQPFFLFTNFIDPHGPYTPPERLKSLYQSNKKRMLNLEQIPSYQLLEGSLNYFDYVDGYDAEIRYVDEAMGVLIEQLKRKGLWDDALVIFTSDHGESFGEHHIYFEHQFHVWEETVRVPLAIRLPNRRNNQNTVLSRRVRSVCSPMDLMPTILDYLNIGFDGRIDGRSLLPILSDAEDNNRIMFLEFPNNSIPGSPYPDIYAVRTATHKLIGTWDQHTGQLKQRVVFNIAKDPLEKRSIRYNSRLKLHHKLADALDSMVTQAQNYELPFTLVSYVMPMPERKDFLDSRKKQPKKIIKTLSEDQIERLRSLGYVK